MAENYPNRKKTLQKKEKLLITSNFSFSHSVFKRIVSKGRQKVSLFGKGLSLYHTIPTFNDLQKEAFWKHCRKRRKCWLPAFFSFSHNVFYPSQNKFKFFSHIYLCCMQILSVWTSLTFCRLVKSSAVSMLVNTPCWKSSQWDGELIYKERRIMNHSLVTSHMIYILSQKKKYPFYNS